MPIDPAVDLHLTPEQSLVLFELLARFCESDRLTVEHPAEQRVLFAISARLDTEMLSPFRPEYAELLAQAREAVASEPVA